MVPVSWCFSGNCNPSHDKYTSGYFRHNTVYSPMPEILQGILLYILLFRQLCVHSQFQSLSFYNCSWLSFSQLGCQLLGPRYDSSFCVVTRDCLYSSFTSLLSLPTVYGALAVTCKYSFRHRQVGVQRYTTSRYDTYLDTDVAIRYAIRYFMIFIIPTITRHMPVHAESITVKEVLNKA